jgi:hypothetical protein
MWSAIKGRAGDLFASELRGKLGTMEFPIQLSSDELAALQRGEPLRLIADESQPVVLVLADQYERLKRCVDFADTDPESLYPLIADVLPEEWKDISAFPSAEKLFN